MIDQTSHGVLVRLLDEYSNFDVILQKKIDQGCNYLADVFASLLSAIIAAFQCY